VITAEAVVDGATDIPRFARDANHVGFMLLFAQRRRTTCRTRLDEVNECAH